MDQSKDRPVVNRINPRLRYLFLNNLIIPRTTAIEQLVEFMAEPMEYDTLVHRVGVTVHPTDGPVGQPIILTMGSTLPWHIPWMILYHGKFHGARTMGPTRGDIVAHSVERTMGSEGIYQGSKH